MRKVAAPVPQTRVVIFRVGSEEFGLDVFSVHEAQRYESVTPVPRAPEFVDGVIDVRGGLVPVIDLRRRFEVAEPVSGPETRILIVGFNGERLALVVDEVLAVDGIPDTAVSPPPEYFRGLAAEYIRGIARWNDRLVILIDMDRVLSSQERIALREAEWEELTNDE